METNAKQQPTETESSKQAPPAEDPKASADKQAQPPVVKDIDEESPDRR